MASKAEYRASVLFVVLLFSLVGLLVGGSTNYLAIGFFVGAISGLIIGLISFAIGLAAEQKGRSFSAFFWLSVLVSPILMGVIVAVISPSMPRSTTQVITPDVQISDGEKRIKCPFCAEWVKAEAIVCKHCGRDIAHEAQVILKAEAETVEMKNSESAAVAEMARLDHEASEAERTLAVQKRKAFFRKPSVIVSMVALIVVVVGAIVAAQVLIPKPSPWQEAVTSCGPLPSTVTFSGNVLTFKPLSMPDYDVEKCLLTFVSTEAASTFGYADMRNPKIYQSDDPTNSGQAFASVHGEFTFKGNENAVSYGWATWTLQ